MWQLCAPVWAAAVLLTFSPVFGLPASALQVWGFLPPGSFRKCGLVTDYIVPTLLLFVCLWALRKKENAYEDMLLGARDGLKLLISLVPTLVLLLTAVGMLRASGVMDYLSSFLSPVFSFVGIPAETALLVLVRPLSGSAALAVGAELMAEHGPDSEIGRTVAVMLGSTETTFYTISVYVCAAGIRKTRYTVPAALFADFVGVLVASLTVRLLF